MFGPQEQLPCCGALHPPAGQSLMTGCLMQSWSWRVVAAGLPWGTQPRPRPCAACRLPAGRPCRREAALQPARCGRRGLWRSCRQLPEGRQLAVAWRQLSAWAGGHRATASTASLQGHGPRAQLATTAAGVARQRRRAPGTCASSSSMGRWRLWRRQRAAAMLTTTTQSASGTAGIWTLPRQRRCAPLPAGGCNPSGAGGGGWQGPGTD